MIEVRKMDTNVNHLNVRKDYLGSLRYHPNPFDFWEEVRKFHKEREQEEKEHDQH